MKVVLVGGTRDGMEFEVSDGVRTLAGLAREPAGSSRRERYRWDGTVDGQGRSQFRLIEGGNVATGSVVEAG